MTAYLNIEVRGDPAAIKASAMEVLTAQGFKVDWQDEWTGHAERGSKTANYLSGGLTKHQELGVRILQNQSGNVLLQLASESVGNYGGPSAWVGERVGRQQMDGTLASLRTEVESKLSNVGVVVGVTEG